MGLDLNAVGCRIIVKTGYDPHEALAAEGDEHAGPRRPGRRRLDLRASR